MSKLEEYSLLIYILITSDRGESYEYSATIRLLFVYI